MEAMQIEPEPAAAEGGLDGKSIHALSRQIGTFGLEGQVKITCAKVFISGMGPLGVEVAKNVCLAGVRSLTIHDTVATQPADLGGNFYLSESSVGKNRAEETLLNLRNLNPTVSVTCAPSVPLSDSLEMLEGFNVVVLTDTPIGTQITINEYCRANKIKFVSAAVRGVFCTAFADFGADFETSDKNGEPVKEVMLHGISSASPGVVSTVRSDASRADSHLRHDFDDGDYVQFRDCPEMAAFEQSGESGAIQVTQKGLHGDEVIFAHKLTVLNKHQFSIGDTSSMAEYCSDATCQQVKVRESCSFQSLADSLKHPGELCEVDMFKAAVQYPTLLLHLGFQALSVFEAAGGGLPGLWNAADAARVVEICHELTQAEDTALHGFELNQDRESILKLLSLTSRACLPPLGAFLGGFVAQEVLKAIMHKYTPLNQFMYLGSEEVIPAGALEEGGAAAFTPKGDRTDNVVACIGQPLADKLQALRVFMVS